MNVITLTLCPAFDIHADAEELAIHHENFARITAREAGGKGINITRAALAGGYSFPAVVVLGEENGADFSDSLKKDGVPFTPLFVPGRIRENLTVHEKNGEETRISFPGFSADVSLLDRLTEILDRTLSAGDVLAFGGRAPDGLPIPALVAFLARQKERGIRLVLDSRSLSSDDLKTIHPFLIKPNEEEVAAYVGRHIGTLVEAAEAARELQKTVAENVTVSMGSLGAALACEGGVYTVPAPTIRPLSTIGAGDSSIAGFLVGLSQGAPLPDCLRSAVAYGTAACLTEGTKPPRKEDIEAFLIASEKAGGDDHPMKKLTWEEETKENLTFEEFGKILSQEITTKRTTKDYFLNGMKGPMPDSVKEVKTCYEKGMTVSDTAEYLY